MSQKEAEKLYKKILDAFSELDGGAFWLFRDEIIRLLVTPDSMYEGSGSKLIPDLGPYTQN